MWRKGKAEGELRKETGIGKGYSRGNPSALWKAGQNLLSASVSAQCKLLWTTLAPAELLKCLQWLFLRLVKTRCLQYSAQLSQTLESRTLETLWEVCLDPVEWDPKLLKPASCAYAFPLLLRKQKDAVHTCADFTLHRVRSSARVY